jgi:hypothetical protein
MLTGETFNKLMSIPHLSSNLMAKSSLQRIKNSKIFSQISLVMQKAMEEFLFITLMLRKQASDLMPIGLLKVVQK